MFGGMQREDVLKATMALTLAMLKRSMVKTVRMSWASNSFDAVRREP